MMEFPLLIIRSAICLQRVNMDRFPHETGDYIQERAIAMSKIGEK